MWRSAKPHFTGTDCDNVMSPTVFLKYLCDSYKKKLKIQLDVNKQIWIL